MKQNEGGYIEDEKKQYRWNLVVSRSFAGFFNHQPLSPNGQLGSPPPRARRQALLQAFCRLYSRYFARCHGLWGSPSIGQLWWIDRDCEGNIAWYRLSCDYPSIFCWVQHVLDFLRFFFQCSTPGRSKKKDKNMFTHPSVDISFMNPIHKAWWHEATCLSDNIGALKSSNPPSDFRSAPLILVGKITIFMTPMGRLALLWMKKNTNSVA